MPEQHLGPVGYLILEFPGGQIGAGGFAALVERVDRGSLYLIDLEFFRKNADGTLSTVVPHDLGSIDGLDLAEFDGAVTGLLDEDDIATVSGAVTSGSLACVVIYEELGMRSVLEAFAADGAAVIAEGPVAIDDLEAALDSLDA
ncbi:DUF6325 family protein [Gordonia alkaliphila]|uniref:DUF6325 family protein n=1 Tax=Gordonia alkaliphila TaxID=1053547 RepID=UPI001FF5F50B|nr:DUF6325 family protein [Gordonia alkaliphila]MCK0440647.1 DUF6325 family protein [Gordonia alkaliphila]